MAPVPGELLVSKTELAHMAKTVKGNITKMCKGKYRPAMVGARVNINHALVQLYLKKRKEKYEEVVFDPQQLDPSQRTRQTNAGRTRKPKKPSANKQPKPNPKTAPKKKVVKPAQGTDEDLPEEPYDYLAGVLGITVGELIARFGTQLRFGDWVTNLGKVEMLRERRLKNGKTESLLIPGDYVSKYILGPYEAAHMALLSDVPATIASRSKELADAGETKEHIEAMILKILRKTIVACKGMARDALNDAKKVLDGD